jgi:hypothetical protein
MPERPRDYIGESFERLRTFYVEAAIRHLATATWWDYPADSRAPEGRRSRLLLAKLVRELQRSRGRPRGFLQPTCALPVPPSSRND